MKNKAFLTFLMLAAWILPVFAQEPADTLREVRPFGTHVTELLRGRVAGVEVVSSVAEPGMVPTVYIRGVGSTPSSCPLYIVDGVRVYSLDGLSPDDVESVEALRDAAALTLYGPEAADGVLKN